MLLKHVKIGELFTVRGKDTSKTIWKKVESYDGLSMNLCTPKVYDEKNQRIVVAWWESPKSFHDTAEVELYEAKEQQ